jgi:hypothetical protein
MDWTAWDKHWDVLQVNLFENEHDTFDASVLVSESTSTREWL